MLLQQGRMQEFRQEKDTTPSIDKGNILRGSWNFKDPQFSFGSYRPDLCNETQLHSKLFHKSMQISVTHYLTSESAFYIRKLSPAHLLIVSLKYLLHYTKGTDIYADTALTSSI